MQIFIMAFYVLIYYTIIVFVMSIDFNYKSLVSVAGSGMIETTLVFRWILFQAFCMKALLLQRM
jgi:hypothetical protein